MVFHNIEHSFILQGFLFRNFVPIASLSSNILRHPLMSQNTNNDPKHPSLWTFTTTLLYEQLSSIPQNSIIDLDPSSRSRISPEFFPLSLYIRQNGTAMYDFLFLCFRIYGLTNCVFCNLNKTLMFFSESSIRRLVYLQN